MLPHRARKLVAILLASAPLVLPAQAPTRDRRALSLAIDSVVASYLKDGKAAGMSVAVIRGRDTLKLKGYGSADLELGVPTPDRAIYEIGSVTKQFTAAAILQLQDDGKLQLDDNITKYLPDYPTQGYTITIRRLLDHTSGIKGYTEIPKFGAIMTRHLPKDSLVDLFKNEKFDFAPGDAQVYNNSAFFLAGLIIEKASGMSYADYIKKTLFDKAGMKDSRYCSESAIIPRKAHGYDMGPDGLVNKGFIDHAYPFSAGSLCSTVGDMAAWNRALHGGKVLSPAAYRELITPGVLNDGTKLRYAKGLALHDFNGHRTIEHGGGIPGYVSESAYFPDHDAIIIVLINTTGPVSPNAVTQSIADLLFGKAKMEDKNYTGDLAPLVGTYAGVGRGSRLTVWITTEDGKLFGSYEEKKKGAQLRFVGGDTWEVDGSLVTFVRDAGKITTLRTDQAYGYSFLARQP